MSETKEKKSYLDETYNARNPLRRFAHRTRMRLSTEALDVRSGIKVLDFGCGNGLFLNQLQELHPEAELRLIGFEPYLEAIADNKIEIFKAWEEVEAFTNEQGKFDYITCFEVFEHFSPPRQATAIAKLRQFVADDGLFIVSVPIEKGIPSVVKNLIRRIDHPHVRHIYSVKNIVKSALRVQIPEFRSGDEYLSHMGFYYEDLEKIFKEHFHIQRRRFSPFGMLGGHFNSQVFYELTPA